MQVCMRARAHRKSENVWCVSSECIFKAANAIFLRSPWSAAAKIDTLFIGFFFWKSNKWHSRMVQRQIMIVQRFQFSRLASHTESKVALCCFIGAHRHRERGSSLRRLFPPRLICGCQICAFATLLRKVQKRPRLKRDGRLKTTCLACFAVVEFTGGGFGRDRENHKTGAATFIQHIKNRTENTFTPN